MPISRGGRFINYDSLNKLLLLWTVLVLFATCFSFFFYQYDDPFKCKVLVEDGFWLNPLNLRNWQPAGCMLHTYKAREATSCLSNRRVLFIGDTTTRQLFDSLALKLDPSYRKQQGSEESNVQITLSETRLEFFWDPYMNGTEIDYLYEGYADIAERPALTIIGSGIWYLRHQTKSFVEWQDHIDYLISRMDRGTPQDIMMRSDTLMFAPVPLPDYSLLSPGDQSSILKSFVDQMNDHLKHLAKDRDTQVAFAFNEMMTSEDAYASDGLHPSDHVSAVQADILLNLRCNDGLPKKYYFSNTCCFTYPPLNWQQILGFSFVGILIPLAMYFYSKGSEEASNVFLYLMPKQKYLKPILAFGTIVMFCWFADRTQITGKEQKEPKAHEFFILSAISIAVGLATFKKSEKDLPFLNRDQTDEWKGWMQVAILIYHYVGVSKVPYIYNYMRACPTSYLFMTGFGHTVYFLKKDDFSFKRVTATMLRLNLLNIILAYAMRTDYLLYYFAPLVTWNFFIIWTMMFVFHSKNSNNYIFYGKMILFAALATVFCRVSGVLEFTFDLLETVFKIDWDVREWRFRVTLDQYSIFPGMIAAFIFVNFPKSKFGESKAWPIVKNVSIGASALIMPLYALYEATRESKVAYNKYHAYTALFPVAAFVILRNSTQWLRNRHSVFFAWIGRCSLETFLLQFHIWLAADTQGLLMLAPPHWRILNFCVSTPIFLYVSSVATGATGHLTEWIMAAEKKVLPTSKPAAPVVRPSQNEGKEEAAIPLMEQSQAGVPEAVPLNGAAVELEQQNTNGHAKEFIASKTSSKLSAIGKNLKFRVAIILLVMWGLNWTFV